MRLPAIAWGVPACLLLSAIGGLAVGILTSLGQGALPSEVASLANSAGAWCVAAFVLALPNRQTRLGLVLGPIALLAMLAGYDLATIARGNAVSTSNGRLLGCGGRRRRAGAGRRRGLGAGR